jgi:hypothetical protein
VRSLRSTSGSGTEMRAARSGVRAARSMRAARSVGHHPKRAKGNNMIFISSRVESIWIYG